MRPALLTLAALATFALVGCSSNSGTTDTSSNTTATGKKLSIGVIFDSGGIGDKSFNDSANRGLERAKSELGVEVHALETRSNKDFEANESELANQGCDLVIAVGVNQQKPLSIVAPKFPNTKFAIVDGGVDAPNVRNLEFSEQEGSFLAGYLAAMTSKTGKIGFVGGQELPLIKKFYVGFVAGAHMAKPALTVLPPKYTGSWDNIDLGKQAAVALYSEGADIVYHAAGRAGLGVLQAAKDQGKYAIGVDSDQDDIQPGFVLTSMIKHVDEAVFQTIKDLKDGKFEAGHKVYDLNSDGVGLSEMKFTKDKIGAETIKKLADIKQQIIDGKIKVPSTIEELKKLDDSVPG